MKLYYFDVLNPRKVCALARYLNLPVEFVHVDLGKGEHKTPAFLAMNPNAKVPVLVDGNTTLWESKPSCVTWRARPARTCGRPTRASSRCCAG